jgi:hypothetical protein
MSESGLRPVQIEGPDKGYVMQIDNQTLSDDLFYYAGFLIAIISLFTLSLVDAPLVETQKTTFQLKQNHTTVVTYSLANLVPANSELRVEVLNISSNVTLRITTSTFNYSATLAVNCSTWRRIFMTRILNFSALSLWLQFPGSHLQSAALRLVYPTPLLTQGRHFFSVVMLCIFAYQRFVMISRPPLDSVQMATAVLSFFTVLYHDPFLLIHSCAPSTTWLLVDDVLKAAYFSYLMFYGFYVFERLQINGGRQLPVRYFPAVFFVLKVIGKFEALAIGVYAVLFVLKARQTYRGLEASSAYAFLTYCGFAAALAGMFGGIALVEDVLYREVVPLGIATAFAMLMERAHAEAAKDVREWGDPSDDNETNLDPFAASDRE